MKKNKMMRTAAGLLVATLLTTSVISGTFAKYTTTNSGSDSARVAKFGVVLQAEGSLYGQYYGTGANSIPITTNTAAQLSVSAQANAVAPGTQNDAGLNFSINGTPEVRTQLKATVKSQNIYLKKGTYAVMVKAPNVTATSWKADTYYTKDAQGIYNLSTSFDANNTTYYTKEDAVELQNDYYPVIYKADLTNGSTTADSLNAIAADYAKKLNGNVAVTGTTNNDETTYSVTKVYDPNTDLSQLEVSSEKLTWAWAFDTQNNGADTILADLQDDNLTDAEVVVITTGESATIKAPVEHANYNLNTSFSIEITVEQVD